jgi:hypothetical protein
VVAAGGLVVMTDFAKAESASVHHSTTLGIIVARIIKRLASAMRTTRPAESAYGAFGLDL